MKSWMRRVWSDAKEMQYFDKVGGPYRWDDEHGEPYEVEPEPMFVNVLRVVGFDIAGWFWVKVAKCDHPSRYWVDEGYGGPETGCMAGHCEMCGWGFHETLY